VGPAARAESGEASGLPAAPLRPTEPARSTGPVRWPWAVRWTAPGAESGRATVKIPPGTQTGQKLRMREKGVTSATREGHRGDQIVEVKIVVPKVQDERSKEILRELQKLNPEDVRAEMLAGV